jgi:hypothetical protein
VHTQSLPIADKTIWRLVAILGVVLLGLLGGTQFAAAEGIVGSACMNTKPCTANDVKIKTLIVMNDPVCLPDAQKNNELYADVDFVAEILTSATARYDVGLWIALDGGSANTGPDNQCYHGILRPLETIEDFTTSGPFRNLDGDYCGDALQNDGLIYQTLQTLHIKCTDTSGTGLMQTISTCTSWDNNANTICNGVADALPGTGSKCNCSVTAFDPPIEVPATITVEKVAWAMNSEIAYCPGRVFGFNLEGGGVDEDFGLRSNECEEGALPATSKTIVVQPGSYTISETDLDINVLANGWTLESISCTGTGVGEDPDWDGLTGSVSVSGDLGPGQVVTCIFTNSQDSPLAVDLLGFTANASGGRITLTWETVSEIGNAGFNVYRAEAATGPWTKVNKALIAAKAPGSTEGNSYQWTDTTAKGGGTFWYALEDVTLDGVATMREPVSAVLAGPNAVAVSGFGGASVAWPALAGLLGVVALAISGFAIRKND